MNLESLVDAKLWEAIQRSWENGAYTNAIQDAIYYVSDLIRSKSGLEGDGVNLVGQAFGGESPVLKVNSLRTESEKNVQKGVEQMLRGVYFGIRNPRAHEKHRDSKADARAIICFLGYLAGVIDQSTPPFTMSAMLDRVFDASFVETSRYAELLVQEIPANRRLEALLEVYARKERGEPRKLRYFVSALWDVLEDEAKEEVYRAVSEDLKSVEDDVAIRAILGILPPECWSRYDESGRMRAENRIIASVADGRYNPATDRCSGGALGAWAVSVAEHFLLKEELLGALTAKLASSDRQEQDYVFCFWQQRYLKELRSCPRRLRIAVKAGLRAGDSRFYSLAQDGKRAGASFWSGAFEQELESYTEVPSVADDEIPF